MRLIRQEELSLCDQTPRPAGWQSLRLRLVKTVGTHVGIGSQEGK